MITKSFKIEFIPHSEQRYETCGDWIVGDDGNHTIRVSIMNDERYSWLVAFHELAEFMLCLHRGIKQKDVDAFDIQFEKDREAGKHEAGDECGDDPNAPYAAEHFFATTVERQLARELGIDNGAKWKGYDDTVMGL